MKQYLLFKTISRSLEAYQLYIGPWKASLFVATVEILRLFVKLKEIQLFY